MSAETETPQPDPSVSVVVATRDRRELLDRAARSILDQRYAGRVEVLLVFDRSDPVEPAIGTPSGRTVRVLRNTRTPGLAGARNTGILEASGELIAFCDDDDEWLPGKLRSQARLLGEAPGASLVATGIEVVADGRRTERIAEGTRIEFDDLLRSRIQELHPSSFLLRRDDVLDRIGLVDEQIPGSYGEDYEFLLRAAKAGPIAYVREPLVRVHWHRSSFFQDRWAVVVRAIAYLLDRYPEFGRSPRGLARLRGRMAFAYAAMGERAQARRWARSSLAANPFERRAYLALVVSSGLLPAATLVRIANRAGRGI